MQFKVTNVIDEGIQKKLSGFDQYGKKAVGAVEIKPIHTENRRFHDWELIKRDDLDPNVIIIHIFPKPSVMKDEEFMFKMKEAIREQVILELMHFYVLAEWIQEVDSFCISYLSVPDGANIAIKFMNNVSENLRKRIS
jgi:hypothetical protein